MIDVDIAAERYFKCPTPYNADRLASVCANIVRAIAIKHRHRDGYDTLSDLIAAGNMGLAKAINGFDATCGTKFSTYATEKVRGEILHDKRDFSRVVREPGWLQDFKNALRKHENKFRDKYEREGTDAEISASMKIPLAVFIGRKEAMNNVPKTFFEVEAPDVRNDEGHLIEYCGLAALNGCAEEYSGLDPIDLIEYVRALEELRRWIAVEKKAVGWIVRETGLPPSKILSMMRSIKENCPYSMA